MINIEIKAIPLSFASHLGERRTRVHQVLNKLFKSMYFLSGEWNVEKGFKIIEAGKLDGTRFRVSEELDIWVDALFDSTDGITTVTIRTSMSGFDVKANSHEVDFVLLRYVRCFRNFCEEFYEYYSESIPLKHLVPVIGEYSLPEELIGSDVDKLLATISTVKTQP